MTFKPELHRFFNLTDQAKAQSRTKIDTAALRPFNLLCKDGSESLRCCIAFGNTAVPAYCRKPAADIFLANKFCMPAPIG